MPTSTYKSLPRPRNAPVFFALTPHFWLIWTAVGVSLKRGIHVAGLLTFALLLFAPVGSVLRPEQRPLRDYLAKWTQP